MWEKMSSSGTAEEPLSSTQPQSVETSPKYESWGPLYIQETGEEQHFTPELRHIQGSNHLSGPPLSAPGLVVEETD